jgi:hypothetical protein
MRVAMVIFLLGLLHVGADKYYIFVSDSGKRVHFCSENQLREETEAGWIFSMEWIGCLQQVCSAAREMLLLMKVAKYYENPVSLFFGGIVKTLDLHRC